MKKSTAILTAFAVSMAFAGTAMADGMQGSAGSMGGGMQSGMSGDMHEEQTPFGEPGKAEDVTRTVVVTMQDVAYDHENMTIKNGETIRFIIVNKDDTEHEFTLGTMEMNAADRIRMAKMMDAGQDMSMAGEENAVSVGPLETKELIWHFKEAGDVEFACNVPGHYEAGMHGPIIFQGE